VVDCRGPLLKAASIAGDQERASAWLRIANAISEFAARGVSRTVH